MHRQLVWYPDGSPVAVLAQALPAEFEARALSETDTPAGAAPTIPDVLVVDLEADSRDAAAPRWRRPRVVPVVALLEPGEAPRGWPTTSRTPTCRSRSPRSCSPRALEQRLRARAASPREADARGASSRS